MGDSYSSGEGIGEETSVAGSPYKGKGKFYDYTGDVKKDVTNSDWLAHRSEFSWPSRLIIPGVTGKLGDHHVKLDVNQKPVGETDGNCKWYFVASSGATTYDLIKFNEAIDGKVHNGQPKEVKKLLYSKTVTLPLQIEIFDSIPAEKVDYVTLTIGGNDVGFAEIIKTAMTTGKYFKPKKLQNQLDALWDDIDIYKARIKKTYQTIADKAKNATILVAGYPKLIREGGNGKVLGFSADQAKRINEDVVKFNRTVLAKLVEECRSDGADIWFVEVAGAFEGHEAYSDNPMLNPAYILAKSDDLSMYPPSAYSVHPNDSGAQAYADCVNEKIKQRSRGYQIVLSWGDDPSDLDAHLEGSLSDGSAFHLYHKNTSVTDGGAEVCDLDKDYMMYYGPETVSLNATSDKPYYYYVYRNRGAKTLETSNAKVEVYQDGALVETFNVPTGTDNGNYWNVFAIVDGKIQVQNTITAEADTNYANK